MTRGATAVVAAVLTVAAIAGWWSTFDGVAWLLVGAAGAALGAGVVLLHHRTGTLVWAILTVPLAYLVLGVAVLGVEFGGNGAPRVETLTRVISGAVGVLVAARRHPPTGRGDRHGAARPRAGRRADRRDRHRAGAHVRASRLAGRAAARAADRRARDGQPRLDSVGRLVGLAGAAYGLACLVWAVVRAGAGAFAGARWPFAAPILVVCALLAVPVGDSLLGDQRERLVLREETAAYGVSVVGTPLDAFRRFRKQPGDLPDNAWRMQLLRATASPGGPRRHGAAVHGAQPLRRAALDRRQRRRAGQPRGPVPAVLRRLPDHRRGHRDDADADRADRRVEQPVGAAGRPAGRAERRLPRLGPGERPALQPGHVDRGGDPDAGRQRRVRVLLRAPRHHAPRRREALAAPRRADVRRGRLRRHLGPRRASRGLVADGGRARRGGDDEEARPLQRRRVRLGGAVRPRARTATASTTSSTARTWSATTSSTPRRWRWSPPGCGCPRAWSSARGCRPTASSRATT